MVPLDLRDALYARFAAAVSDPRGGRLFARLEARAEAGRLADAYLVDRAPRYRRALERLQGRRSPPAGLDEALGDAAALLEEGLYFDCHEWLEAPWRAAAGAERRALQGLIQAGAGLHKLELGSPTGCAQLLSLAAAKLRGLEGPHGPRLSAFAARLEAAAARVREGTFDWTRAPRL